MRLLSGSPFYIAQTRAVNWAKAININQFLYIFNQEYGLPISGMSPPGGWEAPNQKLRGHMTGHTLSNLGLAYAATGEATIKTKMEQLINGLDTCQKRATIEGMSAGCLSAYGEDQFTALENGGGYPNDCWAPWYTQHKLLAGLLTCYKSAGNAKALDMAKLMGTWAYNRLSKVSASTLQSMWSRYIAGEYGGYNESAAELYMVTGTENYKNLAKLFDDNSTTGASLTNLINNTNRLGGTHANMYLPRGIGYLRTYDATKESKYLTAASNFYDMISLHHSFSIGGHNANSSNCEAFMSSNAIGSSIGLTRTCEHCGTYNSAKYCRYMLFHNAEEKYANFDERWSINHLLANANIPAGSSGSTPLSSYMTEVKCGTTIHEWQQGTGYTCCYGTGVETHLRYKEGIYAYNGDTLFINQFIPSQLTWPQKNVTIKMEGRYPESDTLRITITPTNPIRMFVKVRAPSWVRRPIGIAVNDTVRHQGPIKGGTYFVLRRTAWKPTQPEVVRLIVPQTLWFERTPDNANVGSILYGNCVLAAKTSSTSYQNVNAGTLTKSAGSALQFTSTSPALTFVPFYMVGSSAYSIYTNISSIPASWTDEVLDQVNDPIYPYDNDGVDIRGATSSKTQGVAVTPAVKMSQSQLQLTFTFPFAEDQNLRVQLFNVQGAKVAELDGELSKGMRTIALGSPKPMLSAGAYVCRISVGGESFRAPLVYER
ncbi:MAG: glycoside hydrolase family 127 protein [Chitinispirillaceae bacterium]|nr:glycoside hydrolase family 127 protein [Chitinispirillaceae bacterium]